MGIVKCQTIISLLEKSAPKKLAESWDNVGLLVGDGSQAVKKIMVCLDVPEWVLDEAIENKVDMIVAHHPMIFSGIKRVNTDTALGKKIIKLIKNNISLYCLHTNYDIAAGGLNDIFANMLGFQKYDTISVTSIEKLYKLVVYVPKGDEDTLRNVICNVGAGHIGNYSECTFMTEGTGTFRPEAGSQPFIGRQGKLEIVEEVRLETIVTEKLLSRVIKEMLKVHPYEEAAYDIIPLSNEGSISGIGRIAELENPTILSLYADHVKHALGIEHIRVAGDPNKSIKKIALLNGTGNKFVNEARYAGADVLVTGDMQYHEIVDALEAGICIIDAGHHATEKIMIKTVAEYLHKTFSELKYDIEVIESKNNVDPISVV